MNTDEAVDSVDKVDIHERPADSDDKYDITGKLASALQRFEEWPKWHKILVALAAALLALLSLGGILWAFTSHLPHPIIEIINGGATKPVKIQTAPVQVNVKPTLSTGAIVAIALGGVFTALLVVTVVLLLVLWLNGIVQLPFMDQLFPGEHPVFDAELATSGPLEGPTGTGETKPEDLQQPEQEQEQHNPKRSYMRPVTILAMIPLPVRIAIAVCLPFILPVAEHLHGKGLIPDITFIAIFVINVIGCTLAGGWIGGVSVLASVAVLYVRDVLLHDGAEWNFAPYPHTDVISLASFTAAVGAFLMIFVEWYLGYVPALALLGFWIIVSFTQLCLLVRDPSTDDGKARPKFLGILNLPFNL